MFSTVQTGPPGCCPPLAPHLLAYLALLHFDHKGVYSRTYDPLLLILEIHSFRANIPSTVKSAHLLNMRHQGLAKRKKKKSKVEPVILWHSVYNGAHKQFWEQRPVKSRVF